MKQNEGFEEIIERLKGCLENEMRIKRIIDAKEYIRANWIATKLEVRCQEGVKGNSWDCFTCPKHVY